MRVQSERLLNAMCADKDGVHVVVAEKKDMEQSNVEKNLEEVNGRSAVDWRRDVIINTRQAWKGLDGRTRSSSAGDSPTTGVVDLAARFERHSSLHLMRNNWIMGCWTVVRTTFGTSVPGCKIALGRLRENSRHASDS